MPKYAKLAVSIFYVSDSFYRVVDAKILMVFGNNLNSFVLE